MRWNALPAMLIAAVLQTPTPNAVGQPLRAHLQQDRFDAVTSVRGLPLGVRDGLQTLFKATFLDIAEPGAAFSGDEKVAAAGAPARRLIAAACSSDHCMVYYERGNAPARYLAVFHWTPAATRFEWGGIAPGGVSTIDDLRKAALSGAIKPAGSW